VTSENPPSEISNPPRPAYRSRAAILLFVLTAGLGLAVDLWTKSHSWHALTDGGSPYRDDATGHLRVESDTTRAIPDWLHFKVTVNEGAVFGIGQGNQMLFAVVSVGAIALLTWLFATSTSRFYQFVLGMLMAGVLGNLYDRMVYGYVRDMIYALPGWRWPGSWRVPGLNYPGLDREVFPWIFNIADTLLCVGVGLMVIYSFFLAQEPTRDESAKKEPAVQPAQ
jgi:signal peptidase II